MSTRVQSDAIRQELNAIWQPISGSFNFSYTSIAGFPRLLLHHDGSLYVLAAAGSILWLKPEYQIDGGAWTDSGWGPDGGKFTFPAGLDGTVPLQCNRPCFPGAYPAGTVINTRVLAKCSGSVVLCDSLISPYPDVSKTWMQAESHQWNDAEDEVPVALVSVVSATGQTVCYDSTGTIIPSAGTNQDGDLQAGVAWPVPRFTVNGDGTTTDNLTGLIWSTNANVYRGIWQDALNAANAAQSGMYGLTDGSVPGDWRMPNILEFRSLVADQYSFRALTNAEGDDKHGASGTPAFTDVQSQDYWTSNTYRRPAPDFIGSDFYAYTFTTGAGEISNYSKPSAAYLWLVKDGNQGDISLPKTGVITSYDENGNIVPNAGSGQDGAIQAGIEWPSPRFSDNGDGTVTDNLSSLIWLKTTKAGGVAMNWQSALNQANTIADGNNGLTDGSSTGDWKVPNVNELRSLFCYKYYSPALTNAEGDDKHGASGTSAFTDVENGNYWTSTSYSSMPSRVLIVTGDRGLVRSELKTATGGVLWAVKK